MFKLVVLSALVAVSVAAPSGLISPYTYVHQPQTLVQVVPSVSVVKSAALVGSVPTSVSSQSSTVVHGSNHLISAPVVQYAAPGVEVIHSSPFVASHAVIKSVPTSVSSQSSTVVHDARPVVSSVVSAPGVQVVDTPLVEVAKSVPTVQVIDRDVELFQPTQYASSVPSRVVHNSSPAFVSAYSPVAVRQSPVVEYSEPLVEYSPIQYSNAVNVVKSSPFVQYSAAAPLKLSSYSTHGVINSAGYLASPAIVQDW